MFGWPNKNQKLIKQVLKLNPVGPLKSYLTTPLPAHNSPVLQVEYLVLDFETTGLSAAQDHIISTGFTHIKHGRVQLRNSQHHLVKTKLKLTSENVSIHHITDDLMQSGMTIQAMMNLLLHHMAGKVLIVHYKKIEHDFIQHLSQKLFGHPLPLLMVDTMQLEAKRLNRLQQVIKANQLRLFNLREQYQLPRYHAHNALEDALATAELFLAQISHRQLHGYQLKLKDILS